MSYYRIIRRNAASSGWLPSDLTSLYAWYDADSITGLSDGDPVSTWEDRESSYDLTASGTNRPLYQTNELNGKAVVEFNGTRRIKASTAADWGFLHGKASGDKATIVGVWKTGTSSNPGARYALMATGGTSSDEVGMMLQYRDDGSATDDLYLIGLRGVGSTYVFHTDANDLQPNAFRIISCWMDPHAANADRVALGIDGGSMVLPDLGSMSWLTLGTPSTADPTGPLELGSQPANGANALVGAIAEVCIFNAKLSDADRQKTEGYLAHKWGLSAGLPNDHPHKNSAPTL